MASNSRSFETKEERRARLLRKHMGQSGPTRGGSWILDERQARKRPRFRGEPASDQTKPRPKETPEG